MSHKKAVAYISKELSQFKLRYIDSKGPEIELRRVQDFIRNIFQNGGYEKSGSGQDLTPWSKWIYVEDEGEIISAQRIVKKTKENRITIEQASVRGEDPDFRYSVEGEGIADWNSVAFENSKRGIKAAFLNGGEIIRHCLEENYKLVLGFSNPQKRGIERHYLANGAIFSSQYSKPVFFPSDSLNGKSFDLNIIEIGKTTLQRIAEKI
ncbi:hypothetical protein EHO60_14875 [Leptospira fletcheri]|uniref:Uncharacterized protein n=1 Tax=Leptospira fletcheri TaxID=2484981 RepID=A0A4R9G488_9LEPT|nr:hypothetical protein [Leptospira fletcheri]TGK06326.1 hypothetical protein EHO60_14875 [Leptospira fletcheri]